MQFDGLKAIFRHALVKIYIPYGNGSCLYRWLVTC